MMLRNTAGQSVAFQAISTTDGSAVTTGSATVNVTLDNGILTAGAGTVAHKGNGQWNYVPTQAETDAVHVVYQLVLTGAITHTREFYTEVYDHAQIIETLLLLGVAVTPNLVGTYFAPTYYTPSYWTPGYWGPLLTGSVQTQLGSIQAKTDIITNNQVYVISPLLTGTLHLVKGESYGSGSGKTLGFVKPSGASWPADLIDFTVTFNAQIAPDNTNSGTTTLAKTMVHVVDTGVSQEVRLDLLTTDTDGLALGRWDYTISASDGTDVNVLQSGAMFVRTIEPG